jgi:hypothetical protein
LRPGSRVVERGHLLEGVAERAGRARRAARRRLALNDGVPDATELHRPPITAAERRDRLALVRRAGCGERRGEQAIVVGDVRLLDRGDRARAARAR